MTGWFHLAWYGASLGLLIGALSERSEVVEKIWHPCQYLLIPLSGSFFLVKSRSIIPPSIAPKYFALLRFGTSHRWYCDIGYVVMVNIVLTLLGLAQVRYASKNLALEQ